MKTYIVYKNGYEIALLKAGNHNAAERKAIKKYADAGDELYGGNIQVVYTEV